MSHLNSKFRQTALVIALSTSASSSFAAGLEIYNQSIAPFFEPGNYAEIGYAYVKPDVTGNDVLGNKMDNMLESYHYPSAAVKIAPTPNTALALLYQTPWGLSTAYTGDNIFATPVGGTKAKINSKNLTLLGGGKTQNNIWLYGGLSVEQIDADVSINSYDAENLPFTYQLKSTGKPNAVAPVVGIGFEKPEIALKTSLTYRGATKYNLGNNETFNLPTEGCTVAQPGNVDVKMPQSVNFDFQTGLSEKYKLLGTLNARWVNWKQFDVNPNLYAATIGAQTQGEHLAKYDKDGYSVEAALGREFTPKLAAEIRLGYDSGTGQPLNALGPYDAIKSVALGAQYKLTPQMTLGGGVQYNWIDGGEIKTAGQTLAKIDDSSAIGYGVKLGYHF